jgi:hypothetical protein
MSDQSTPIGRNARNTSDMSEQLLQWFAAAGRALTGIVWGL